MKTIAVYDYEAKKIDEICFKYDTTEAELIEALLENISDDELAEIL